MAETHIADVAQRGSSGSVDGITLFDHLIGSDLPESEKSVDRLASEAQILIAAGTSTTARSMAHLAVHILLDDGIREKLREELRVPMQDYPRKLPSSGVLMQLPYLQACIKEGLR